MSLYFLHSCLLETGGIPKSANIACMPSNVQSSDLLVTACLYRVVEIIFEPSDCLNVGVSALVPLGLLHRRPLLQSFLQYRFLQNY